MSEPKIEVKKEAVVVDKSESGKAEAQEETVAKPSAKESSEAAMKRHKETLSQMKITVEKGASVVSDGVDLVVGSLSKKTEKVLGKFLNVIIVSVVGVLLISLINTPKLLILPAVLILIKLLGSQKKSG
jgi:hypothetical protein